MYSGLKDNKRESLEKLFTSILYNFDKRGYIEEVKNQFNLDEIPLNVYEIVTQLGYKIFKIENNDNTCELIIDEGIYSEYNCSKVINIKVQEEEKNRYAVWFVLVRAWLLSGNIRKGLNVHINYKENMKINMASDIMASIVAKELSN